MMAIREHIVELDNVGWLVIHPLWCPGDLKECPVTKICQQMTTPPKTGRFWGAAVQKGQNYHMELGDEVPRSIEGTSRRTGHSFATKKTRPQ